MWKSRPPEHSSLNVSYSITLMRWEFGEFANNALLAFGVPPETLRDLGALRKYVDERFAAESPATFAVGMLQLLARFRGPLPMTVSITLMKLRRKIEQAGEQKRRTEIASKAGKKFAEQSKEDAIERDADVRRDFAADKAKNPSLTKDAWAAANVGCYESTFGKGRTIGKWALRQILKKSEGRR
jgi:hypothetical protein